MITDKNLPLYSLTIGQFIDLLKAETKPEPQKAELPRYLFPAELAELVNWKLSTVYQNHSHGLIPGARKTAGRLLFLTEEILQWVENKSIPTKAEKIEALTNVRRAGR